LTGFDNLCISGHLSLAGTPALLGRESGATGAPSERDREASAVKRTYQPKKRKRIRTHGFRKRMKDRGGQAIVKRRRAKGRKRLAVGAVKK
jgi:large subunit ribosomal protein L34